MSHYTSNFSITDASPCIDPYLVSKASYLGVVPCRTLKKRAFQNEPAGNWQDKEMYRMPGSFPLMPKSPSLLIMVIQSRLNMQTFCFNEVSRHCQRHYLPPFYLLAQDDGINIFNPSRKWFFSSTIHCNESNLLSLKKITPFLYPP